MEEEFQKWLEQRNAGWYSLSIRQYEWYLNQWLDEIEDQRKELKEYE